MEDEKIVDPIETERSSSEKEKGLAKCPRESGKGLKTEIVPSAFSERGVTEAQVSWKVFFFARRNVDLARSSTDRNS